MVMIRNESQIGYLKLYNGNIRLGENLSPADIKPAIVDLTYISKELPNDLGTKVISAKTMKTKASTFYRSLYDVHKVALLNSKFQLLRLKLIIDLPFKYETMIDKYNHEIPKFIDPFDIPIVYKNNFIDGGSICSQEFFLRMNYPTYVFQDINPSFTKIILDENTNEMSVPLYIHEITHSQVDSIKGSVENFYHEELLSIFNELLYAYNDSEDLFKKMLAMRIRHTIQQYVDIILYQQGTMPRPDYTSDDQYHNMKYMISALKAFNLLYLYINSSSQEDFIKEINDVLEGNIKLEELLDNKKITADSMMDTSNIRKLV